MVFVYSIMEPEYGNDQQEDFVLVETVVEDSSPYSLTEKQQIILALAPIPTALLSIGGSILIIQNVVRHKGKRNSYHRILLAMSLFDILYSITACLQMFLMPRETSPRITEVGNDATCTLVGFLRQLSFATFWYTGVLLSWFYLSTIVYGWKETDGTRSRSWWSRRLVEPMLHGLGICYAIITASAGAVRGWYAELDVGFGCWVNNYPRSCEVIDKSTGEMGPPCLSDEIGWYIAGIPYIVVFLGVIFVNVRIYWHVRATTLQSQRHDFIAHNIIVSSTTSFSSGISENLSNHNNSRTMAVSQAQTRRMRLVATQGVLYVAAFWITACFNAVVRIVEAYQMAETEADIYFLLIAQAIMSPSTGFFNMLVYYRPRYLRCRQSFPEQTRFWAFRRAIYGSKVQPRLSIISDRLSPLERGRNVSRGGRAGSVAAQPQESSDDVSSIAGSRTTTTSEENGQGETEPDSCPTTNERQESPMDDSNG